MIRLILALAAVFLRCLAKPGGPVMARQWRLQAVIPSFDGSCPVLEQGGNAVDAPSPPLWLQPWSNHERKYRRPWHGDIYLAKTGQVYCIDGSGWTGKRATADRFDRKRRAAILRSLRPWCGFD